MTRTKCRICGKKSKRKIGPVCDRNIRRKIYTDLIKSGYLAYNSKTKTMTLHLHSKYVSMDAIARNVLYFFTKEADFTEENYKTFRSFIKKNNKGFTKSDVMRYVQKRRLDNPMLRP